MYTEILFLQKGIKGKDSFTYKIPEDLKLEIGQSVLVPFRTAKKNGLVLDIHNNKPSFITKEVESIISLTPLLTINQITIIEWISRYYFAPLYKTAKLFLPQKILDNKKLRLKAHAVKELSQKDDFNLTEDQKSTIDQIIRSKDNQFLIHGITGSGKTEIYSRICEHYLKENKQVLILVPEISLTPQTIEYFEKSLGMKAEIINSKISEGQKILSWKNLREGKSKLVIGSRSAIFAPLNNLGIIIVDEEHEHSYKQDQSPRYEIHKVIEKIIELDPTIKVVYGSATPSIETAYRLQKNTIKLSKRINNLMLPTIEIVDLREEFKKKNYSIFSEDLISEIENSIKNKEQVILFINRRGSASSVVCRDCGYTVKCKDCDTVMTYHTKTFNEDKLICHHCGIVKNPITICPECKSLNIKFLGIGTQKIETELMKKFPNIKILRADKDTTSQKESFKNIYQDFKNAKAEILIGTQMIAKGLHLPNVNLVGIILADVGLNIPDFRSTEKNFELMIQVAGRAGRNKKRGKVIIQSYNPDSITLQCAKDHDYEKFYNYEIDQRKLLNYPPFSKLAKITIEDKSLENCIKKTEKIKKEIEKNAKEVEVLSYPAFIQKLRNKYHFIILLKEKPSGNEIQLLLDNIYKEYTIDEGVRLDIDPISII